MEIVAVFTHISQLTPWLRSQFEVCDTGVLVKAYRKFSGSQGLVHSDSGLSQPGQGSSIHMDRSGLCHLELGLR